MPTKLIKELTVQTLFGGRRKADDFDMDYPPASPMVLDVERISRPEINSRISFCKRYRIYVTVGTEFDANEVMYQNALETARRRLVSYLYGDVLERLDDIKQLVQGGDRERTLTALDKLHRELTGG